MCYFRQYLHHVQDSAKEICNCNWLAFWMIHVDPKCLQINVEVTHFHRKWLNPIRCYVWVIPNFKAKVLWCSYVALSARVCIHTLGGRQLRHEQPFTIGPNSHGIRAVSVLWQSNSNLFHIDFYETPTTKITIYMKHAWHSELPS